MIEQKEKPTSGLWYVIGGIAVGAALGLLFAPKKGSELREDIGDWSRKSRAKGKSLVSDLKALVPLRIKAAAALGAAKAGGAEAVLMVKENFNLDGANHNN